MMMGSTELVTDLQEALRAYQHLETQFQALRDCGADQSNGMGVHEPLTS